MSATTTRGVAIRELGFTELEIPFKTSFRHASAERAKMSSVWIEAVSAQGVVGYGESCPRRYVTGETLATARAFLSRHEVQLRAAISDLTTLRAWMAGQAGDIDANPAAWCAVEIAILDLIGKESGQTLEALLGLPPLVGSFSYSAVLGDAEPQAFRAVAEQYRKRGFTDLKIKLSGVLERDRDKIAALGAWGAGPLRVRVDANNLWEEPVEAISFLRALEFPFFAVEEPVHPGRYDQLERIGGELDCRIILDESCQRIDQLSLLGGPPDRWLVNLRVSKMGGLLRSLAFVDAALARGIGLIVGAQVGETSVLTRAGLTVAHAARAGLVAQEGAFGTLLLEHDVCDPPLMFGAGGVLDTSTHPALRGDGLGIGPIVLP